MVGRPALRPRDLPAGDACAFPGILACTARSLTGGQVVASDFFETDLPARPLDRSRAPTENPRWKEQIRKICHDRARGDRCRQRSLDPASLPTAPVIKATSLKIDAWATR